MSRKELYFRGLAITKRLLELQDQHHWTDQDLKTAQQIADNGTAVSLHYMGRYTVFHGLQCQSRLLTSFSAFLPVILSQGSPEQVDTYGALAEAHAILGAYAQVRKSS